MDNFKRSVARDFRIKDNELNAILHEHVSYISIPVYIVSQY